MMAVHLENVQTPSDSFDLIAFGGSLLQNHCNLARMKATLANSLSGSAGSLNSKQGHRIMCNTRGGALWLAATPGILAACFAPNASTQSYPSKAIHLLVGYSAGGATDITARMLAQKMSAAMGEAVVVENRPGASGTIATERVAKSPPDGYTLLMATAADTVVPALLAKIGYDFERDLAPVSLVMNGPFVLAAHPSLPVRNIKHLIALARAQSGGVSYGTSGVGSSGHLAGEYFNLMAGVRIVHVPYKGSAEAAIGTAKGEIEMSYPSVASALPLLEAGKLRALAVSTLRRSSLIPSVPTLHESGISGYDRALWNGVLTPARAPKDIVVRISSVIERVVTAPDMREALNKQGLEARSSSPEQFASFIHGEILQNAKLLEMAGVKKE
jgi:tripartite-type tricarboxylate transporter receptor subunit TctC